MKKIFLLALLCVVLLSACAEKKEPPGADEELKRKKDSLLQKSEQLLKPESTILDTTARQTKSQEETAQQPTEPKEPQRVPDMLPQVNVTRWAGMTYLKLDRELGELSISTPPSIHYYGICKNIVFRFTNETPAGKIREITCTLDGTYLIHDALEAIGIRVIKQKANIAPTYVESTCSNEGIARVRSMLSTPTDTTTKKIIVTFK